MTDPIADFLARLRNATSARQPEFFVPYSKMKAEIARILQREGYISGCELDSAAPGKPRLRIRNKYINRSPAIAGLKRVSRPGLRKYVGAQDIPRVLGGMGIAVLSTSRGIMTGSEARKHNVGGELLAYIW
ncbi:MAG: 30S ribosomal protein S8 [Terrimicrobiaceae bacterium]|nr:30S ribosomal protein S8 [Terrimicrobiaceae bacterium]